MGDRLADIDALVARQAITDVLQNLSRGTDRLDRELIASCYHPDAIDDHNAFRGTGDEFAKWVVDALPFFEATTHFIAAPRIALNGETAQCETNCIAHHVTKPDEAGARSDIVIGLRYLDRFERRRRRWRIAKRVCAFDWTYTVPSSGEGFRFEEGFTLGRRDRSDLSYSGV